MDKKEKIYHNILKGTICAITCPFSRKDDEKQSKIFDSLYLGRFIYSCFFWGMLSPEKERGTRYRDASKSS